MIFKLALLMFLAAIFVGLFAKGEGRGWMAKLAYGGFCLLLAAALIRLLII